MTASRFINKVGNIRAFSAFTSLLSALVLTHIFSAEHSYWAVLRLSEGYCIGTISMCLESWLNTRANNKNRGVIMSLYMVTTYLGSSLGQLFLNIPDHTGYLIFILISIIFSVALIPVSLTALPAPNIQIIKSMPYKKAYQISPVGFVGCIASGLLVGTFYLLGTIYASNLGLSIKDVSLFMFFGVIGGLLAQFPGRQNFGHDGPALCFDSHLRSMCFCSLCHIFLRHAAVFLSLFPLCWSEAASLRCIRFPYRTLMTWLRTNSAFMPAVCLFCPKI